MARVKAKELRGKDDSELRFEEENLRKELFDLRWKSAAEGNSNPSRIGQIRKHIAQIQTVISERAKQPKKAEGVKSK